MFLENATNLFVLVSEGTVISTFFIDGLSYSDHLWDKAWIREGDNHVEEACFRLSSFSTGCLRLQNIRLVLDARLRRAEEAAAANTAGRSISTTKSLIDAPSVLAVERVEPAHLVSVVLDWQTQDAVGFVTRDQVHLGVKAGVLQSQNTPNQANQLPQSTFIFTQLLPEDVKITSQTPFGCLPS